MSNTDQDILRFIAASFRSVWALELVLLLKRERIAWRRDDLVSALRASEDVVNKAVDALLAAGLASIDDSGARYLPVNHDVEECMEQVERLYRTRPNVVRRAIVSLHASSATAFADAFRLRKGADD